MKLKFIVGVGILVLVAGAAAWAQTKTDDTGSLAALTNEVRLLRIALEDGTKRQAEVQALGVSLSAQQSRMVQLSSRIDAVRSQLAAAEQRVKQSAFFLQNLQQDMATADPNERAQATEMMKLWKQGADEADAALDSLRRRESDLTTEMRVEEQRWTDLISRLEQTVRK